MDPMREQYRFHQEITPHNHTPKKRTRAEEGESERESFDEPCAKRRGELSRAASDFMAKISAHTPEILRYGDLRVSLILLKALPMDWQLKDIATRLRDVFHNRWGSLSERARIAMLIRALQQQDLEALRFLVSEDFEAPKEVRPFVREQSQLLVELARAHAPEIYHVVLFLIRNGVDVEGYDALFDKNALFWACSYGNYDLIKKLLLRGEREALVQIQHIWDDTTARNMLGMVVEVASCYEILSTHLQKALGDTWMLALRSLSGHGERSQFALKLLDIASSNDRSKVEQVAQEALSRGLISMICPGVHHRYAHQLLRELPRQGAPNCLVRMIGVNTEKVSCPTEEVFLFLVDRALQRHDVDLLASLVKADTRVPDAMRASVQKGSRLLVEIAKWHMPELANVTAFLIRNGANLEAYDVSGDKNALFWACTYANFALIKELLSGNAKATIAQLDHIWRNTSIRHVLGMVAELARSDHAFYQDLQKKIGVAALADLGLLTGHWEQNHQALALLAAVQAEDTRTIENMFPEIVARGLSGLIRERMEIVAREIGERLELRGNSLYL